MDVWMDGIPCAADSQPNARAVVVVVVVVVTMLALSHSNVVSTGQRSFRSVEQKVIIDDG